MEWLHRLLLRFKFYRYFIEWTKGVILPGFRPLPLYTVAAFFFQEIKQGSLVNKASSLAYNFMLAIFPAIIFLFTLIAYIPISNFQTGIMDLLELVMPHNAYQAFESTLADIIKNQNGRLLSFGFISALFFATNGVHNLMNAFNKSSLIIETRSWFKKRMVALLLTVVISLSLFVAITIMIIGQHIIDFVRQHVASTGHAWVYIIAFSRWIIVIVIFFTTVALLYRYGPAHKQGRWKLISPGSILATFLAIMTSLGFTWYINNFSSYNKVYGSIGTLIVVMIWLYLNSLIILIGFELNASIDLSKRTIKIVKPQFNTFKN